MTFHREKETMEEAEGTAEITLSEKTLHKSTTSGDTCTKETLTSTAERLGLSGTLCTKSLVDFDH